MGNKTSTYGKAMVQTEYVADFLGIKMTPRSGGTIYAKSDAQSDIALFECKTYMEKRESFTVKKEWLVKMDQERFQDRKRYAFLVQNFGGAGSEDNHVIMSLSAFKELYDIYKTSLEEE